jgi:uncharacterized protein YraI
LIPTTLILLACTLSTVTAGNPQAPAEQPGGAAPPADVPPTEAAAPTATVAPSPTACTAQLVANSSVNVRGGPGTVYTEVGYLSQNETATIDGQNAEFTWWRILYPAGPGGHGWVAASVSTASCTSGIVAVVPPATPTAVVPIGVTNVVVSVDPKVINFAGCIGPLPESTVAATITVNGPYSLTYHFETDQSGSLPNHNLNFADAGSKTVDEQFPVSAVDGNFWVRLHIDGVDLGGMDYQAKYKINC